MGLSFKVKCVELVTALTRIEFHPPVTQKIGAVGEICPDVDKNTRIVPVIS